MVTRNDVLRAYINIRKTNCDIPDDVLDFMKDSALKNIPDRKQLLVQLDLLKKGCGKKVDSGGDCWYISSQGNTRYCSTCTRKIDKIIKKLEVLS